MESSNWHPNWVPKIKKSLRKNDWLFKGQNIQDTLQLYMYTKGTRTVILGFSQVPGELPEVRICFHPPFVGFRWTQEGFMRARDKKGMHVVVEQEAWFTGLEKLIKDP